MIGNEIRSGTGIEAFDLDGRAVVVLRPVAVDARRRLNEIEVLDGAASSTRRYSW